MVKSFSSKKMLACVLFCGISLGANAKVLSLDELNAEYAKIEHALVSGDLYAAKCSWVRLQKSGIVSRDYRFFFQRARIERALAVEQTTSAEKLKAEMALFEYAIANEAIKLSPKHSEEYQLAIKRIRSLKEDFAKKKIVKFPTYKRSIDRANTLGLLLKKNNNTIIDHKETLENISGYVIEKEKEFDSLANNHYKNAINFLNKAIELSNHTSILYKERAEVYQILGNLDEVIKNYDRFVKLSPYSVDGYFKKATAYYEKANISDYEIAEQYLNTSINDLTKALQLLDEYTVTTHDQIQINRAKAERRTFEELERNQIDLRARLDDKILNDNKKGEKTEDVIKLDNDDATPKKEEEAEETTKNDEEILDEADAEKTPVNEDSEEETEEEF